ncbi:MAG: VanZ family protein [Arenicellales bacterium]
MTDTISKVIRGQVIFQSLFALYFIFLSWQLLSPVTIIKVGEWDKLYHFIGFGALGTSAVLAFLHKSCARHLAIALICYAALTEVIQYFVPGRSFSVLDWLADTAGILVAIMIVPAIYKRLF